MANSPDYHVPALVKGLQIIEMFNEKNRVLTTQDFAEHLGVSVSSIYRIIQTLIDMRYLQKLSRNAFVLGPQVVSRGFAFLAGREIVDIAAPLLCDLRDQTSMSSHLSIRDGLDTVYIYRAQALQRLTENIPLGTRLPCHVNAMGRVLLAQLSDVEFNAMYQSIALDMYPSSYPQSVPELKKLLRKEWDQGYSINKLDNSTAIAVPVTNYLGKTIAAINVTGPDQLMRDLELLNDALDKLRRTAVTISKQVP